MAEPKVLATIIARAGSKGLPGKHTQLLLGSPVIAYSIEAALAAERLDRVILTSDDAQVLEIAGGYDIWTVGRPDRLASDTATVDAAARFGCDRASEMFGFHADIIVILYGNIPVRPPGLIDMAVNHLLDRGGDSVQSYSPVGKWHPDWMIQLEDGDRVVLNRQRHTHRRQNLRPMFMPNGAVIAVTRRSLYRLPEHADDFHAFLGEDRRGFVHPDSDWIVDVDTPRDLCTAEAVLRLIREQADDRYAKSTLST